tara:strand:+ start:225 stop:509 length:285 start_codon:yes stop_codon:yes gene_type:complete
MILSRKKYLLTLFALLIGCSSSASMSRDELKKTINKKSKEEVIEILGKPDQAQSLGSMETWYYTGISYDPLTETTDNMVQIAFENGRVTMINFY